MTVKYSVYIFWNSARGLALGSAVVKAMSALCILLLQRPHGKSEPYKSCLFWKKFETVELMSTLRNWYLRADPHNNVCLGGKRIFIPMRVVLVSLPTLHFKEGLRQLAIHVLAEYVSGRILHINEITPASNSQCVLDELWTVHPIRQPPLLKAVIGKKKWAPTSCAPN